MYIKRNASNKKYKKANSKKKPYRNKFDLAYSTVLAHKHNGYYQYLFISKPEWYKLLDASGKKITVPPAWYVGYTVRFGYRMNAHTKANPTPAELKRTSIQKYLRKNNLFPDARYYFDIYAMDLTHLFWVFQLTNLISREQAKLYGGTEETYIKHHMRDYFLIDGKPVISRFADIWGNNGIEYKKYCIEKIAPHYKPSKQTDQRHKEFTNFISNQLEEHPAEFTRILANAYTTKTEKEALTDDNKRYLRFRKNIDNDMINEYTILY